MMTDTTAREIAALFLDDGRTYRIEHDDKNTSTTIDEVCAGRSSTQRRNAHGTKYIFTDASFIFVNDCGVWATNDDIEASGWTVD